MKRKLILILFLGIMASCATRPNPNPPPDEINVFAENVERVGESIAAVEDTLVCGVDLSREWVFEPLGRLLASLVPFFAEADTICEDDPPPEQ